MGPLPDGARGRMGQVMGEDYPDPVPLAPPGHIESGALQQASVDLVQVHPDADAV
jgi:hypothetical protein